jgi:hypothetical protein
VSERPSNFEFRISNLIRHFLLILLLPACSHADTADEKAVHSHLEHYFATWSAQDMEGYESCFHPQARITFVSGGQIGTEGLTDFLFGQRMSHQQAKSPMKEVPKEMKITVANDIAQCSVRWELQKTEGNVTGTDLFTLARSGDGWKIVALVWEQNK